MRTHPVVIIGGILQQNPFYVPPEQFLREVRETTIAADNVSRGSGVLWKSPSNIPVEEISAYSGVSTISSASSLFLRCGLAATRRTSAKP